MQQDERFNPLAGLAALLFPGLGYLVRRQWRRGLGVAVGVLGLIGMGLLVGGIDVVDREEDSLWFVAQGFNGPIAFGIDRVHQERYKVRADGPPRSATPEEWLDWEGPDARPARKSIGKINDVGSLAVAIAGMLNLIAVLDCVLPHAAPRRGSDRGGGSGRGGPGPMDRRRGGAVS